MIFKISEQFAKGCPPSDLSEICSIAIKNRHFLSVNSPVRKLIRASIVQHGSTKQKQLFQGYRGFNPSQELKVFLTIIDVDATFHLDELYYLVSEKASLVLENRHNEWQVYKDLTALYAKESKYSNLFELLRVAQEKKLIDALNAGGYGGIIDTVEDNARVMASGNLADMKLVSLFDRDTDDDIAYDGNKNVMFKYFNHDKDYLHVNVNDIYTLCQSPRIWHMWYKRAIENYFPDAQYDNCDVDVTALHACPYRDYYKFDKNTPSGYKKSLLPCLTENLNWNEFDSAQKRFTINGKEMSEFELFLLKMVRTI